jgi:hypothetical protein
VAPGEQHRVGQADVPGSDDGDPHARESREGRSNSCFSPEIGHELAHLRGARYPDGCSSPVRTPMRPARPAPEPVPQPLPEEVFSSTCP